MVINSDIVECVRWHNGQQEYTGKYRLVGVPGNYLDLPGRGGHVTKRAAKIALAIFASGGSWQHAYDSIYNYKRG